MAAFFRQNSPTQQNARTMFERSRDALDIAESIRGAAFDAQVAGDKLLAFPADAEERIKARDAARQILADCDALERLTS